MKRIQGSGNYGDFNGRSGRVGGHHIYRGPYAAEALREASMHADTVHSPEVKRARAERERDARYQAMKDELARARRAASGR